MIKPLTSIFLIFAFCVSAFHAVYESMDIDLEKSVAFDHVIESGDCKDCAENNCDENDCCLHLCVTGHVFMPISKYLYNVSVNSFESSKKWYFYYSYNSPFLDPSLKPPLFS